MTEKVCNICGKHFHVPPSVAKKGWGNSCSIKCQSISKTGANNPMWKGGKIQIQCKNCGKTFIADKCGNRKFCSRGCGQKWHKGKTSGRHNWTGALNPKWNGGISAEKEIARKSIQYKQWRQRVFIKDNFTCQDCGQKSGNDLIVHHVKPFSMLLQEVKEYLPLIVFNEAILLYSPLWDISNGSVLCKGCHAKIHKNS